MQAGPPALSQFASDFRLGDWLVEPSLDRLSRNGTVVRLRPQLTDLLVLLARHAGHTVSKEAILSEVWAGQFVAESGMTRCIAEIRQALGDDARVPTIIETIPKRGYRLVAPVIFPEPPADPLVPARVPEAGASPDAASAPLAEGPAVFAEGPTPPADRPGPTRRALRVVASGLGATFLLLVVWGATGSRDLRRTTERDTVVLADVTNSTGDSAFDDTLRLALAVHLGQAPFLRVLPPQHVRAALALMGRAPDTRIVGPVAREACQREGAAVLLAGSVGRLGSHFTVGLEAIACDTGESIARELREVANKEGVLKAFESAADALRRRLGESRDSLREHAVPMVRATTPSLEALKALSVGDDRRDHARMAEALTFYRRATDLDPQFALAWARRGAAAMNVELEDESKEAFLRAYELRDRVSEPERLYILGHYYRFVVGDFAKVVETYQTWKRVYPGSPVPPTNLASLYLKALGQYDAAVPEAREAVRLAPYSSVANGMLIRALLGTNQLAEARAALRAATGRGVRDLAIRLEAFDVAVLDGDAAAMQEQVDWAAGEPSAQVAMAVHSAMASASAGRLRASRREWSQAEQAAVNMGSPSRRLDVDITRAWTEALLGDARAARAGAEAAAAADRRPPSLLHAAMMLAFLGNASRADELISEADPRSQGDFASQRVWLPVARALARAARGRPAEALDIISAAGPFERGRDYFLAPLGARGWIELRAGRPRDAAATFNDLLRLRTVLPTSPWVPYARLGLARALCEAGDVSASRTAYDSFLEAMSSADPDAPLLVAARRERAALRVR